VHSAGQVMPLVLPFSLLHVQLRKKVFNDLESNVCDS